MEIELPPLTHHHRLRAAGLAILILGLVLLALLGRCFTPVSPAGMPQVLTWTEWQVQRAGQAYRAELAHLQQDAALLAGLLNNTPDPVRAQLAAERLTRDHAQGQPALQRQRDALLQAARAVQDWAAGVAAVGDAQAALQEAIAALRSAETPMRTPLHAR